MFSRSPFSQTLEATPARHGQLERPRQRVIGLAF
jgi:hypothetical protein